MVIGTNVRPSTTIAHPRNSAFGLVANRAPLAGLAELKLKL